MTDFLNEALEHFPFTQAMRRDLHMHPELGFQEFRTAGIVAKELESLGLEVTKGVGRTGVVALLEGAKPGPVLLVRFDMDALPIVEETGAEYASQNNGVMHACGHDGHTAIGLTVAKMLHAHRDQLAGTVKFVFQPAEETVGDDGLGGAEMMIKDGVLDGPKPDLALGLHLWNEKPFGWLGIGGGPVMAGAEWFRVRVSGKGGHGAAPHTTVDPVTAAAQMVSALQNIVARNVSPLDTTVVSVTSLHAGTAWNVIPQEAVLEGTIRTFDPAVREHVLKRFDEIVGGVGAAMGCRIESEVKRVTPAVINDGPVMERVRAAAHHLLDAEGVDFSSDITMGAEDMAFILERVPGCYFFVGSANHERNLDYGHHHPKFDFDERALPRAAALMAGAAAEILS